MKVNKSILIIDDEPDLVEVISEAVSERYQVVLTARNAQEAEAVLTRQNVHIVISDIHMPGRNGLRFLEDMNKKLTPESRPTWIFITADGSPETIQTACQLGAVDVIGKPFSFDSIQKVLDQIEGRAQSPILEILDIVQNISGVQLGQDKKLLVETRLTRRARLLGLNSVQEYLEFFKRNRKTEIKELISLITTHTTELFREPDHFDFLSDRVFPQLIKENRPIRIWSAACSSGEEVYSLAICALESLRERGVNLSNSTIPPVTVLGTDIDFNSIERAQNGVYEKRLVERLRPDIVNRYFDFGTGKLAEYARVKDLVHRCCTFKQHNLLSENYQVGTFDVIFLRNVLIYFNSEKTEKIVTKLNHHLDSKGYLFLGHSESLTGMKTPYRVAGNSIYQSASAPNEDRLMEDLAKSGKAKKVFIVDDSPTIRLMLKKILTKEKGFEVVGEAANPIEADKLWPKLNPDIITLDIHMPEMDGVSYLETLKGRPHPPIVMISSITYDDAVSALRCLELGAVDYIEKPQGLNLHQEAERIVAVLGGIRSPKQKISNPRETTVSPDLSYRFQASDMIVIGASTGGTEAIKEVLMKFPKDCPPILIVQHIPPIFSSTFAKRLNEVCSIDVVEAIDGQELRMGCAYIAPGGSHMGVEENGGKLRIKISDAAPVNRHRPSVDFLFESVAQLKNFSKMQVSAALLTGMGADGARGLKKLRDLGGHTIAQNEETCVVYGMPKAANDLGAAIEVLPLASIGYHLLRGLHKRKAA